MEPKEQRTLEQWLSRPVNFAGLKDEFKADFSEGAIFVPICGDGNCFFSACSVSLTCGNEKKFGTKRLHNELRQKVCDHIEKEEKKGYGTLSSWLKSRGTTGEKFKKYIKNKRSTEGSYSSWSDYITFRAMIE